MLRPPLRLALINIPSVPGDHPGPGQCGVERPSNIKLKKWMYDIVTLLYSFWLYDIVLKLRFGITTVMEMIRWMYSGQG